MVSLSGFNIKEGSMAPSLPTMDNGVQKLVLPGTTEDITLLLKDNSVTDEVISSIKKYSGGALLAGRSLDSLHIILAGYSGSGKSSTINFLLNDPALCQTSSLKSETRDPVMVQKRLLCCQAKGPPVEGILNLVDLPGNFDTDSRKEVCNLVSIRKFIDSMFASREGVEIPDLASSGKTIRSTVYPNLVLFTLKATDNRLEGNNTNLRKALTLLKKIPNLVDTENPNVIILITHVCSLGLHATYFNEDLNEKKVVIRQVVKEVLGLPDVDIIPIENQPQRYQLEKSGEFYKLPNEELSHYNLYQAMLKRLEKNNDHIGQLFANWYFQSSCPEKQTTAEAILPTIDINFSDLAKAATELHHLEKGTEFINPVSIFKFELLGFGYCPATEKVKLNILPRRGADDINNLKHIEISGNHFMIPNYVSENLLDQSSTFQRLTFLEKCEYKEHMKTSYGINDRFELMLAGSESKWINDSYDWRGIRKLSFAQQFQLASLCLNIPENFFKCSIFYNELTSLPVEYKSEEDAKKYLGFFAKYGTHLICEVSVGGNFQINCTIKNTAATKKAVETIENEAQEMFDKLFGNPHPISLTQIHSHALRKVGVIQEELQLQGGDVPSFADLESMTFDDVDAWKKSLVGKPVELRATIKLIPFYELLDDKESPLYKCLVEATKRYMEEPGASCFPSGTQVWTASGESKGIEQLSFCNGQLKTLSLDEMPLSTGIGTTLGVGGVKVTEFCTFLDKRPCDFVKYLVLQFSNGKKLTVSPCHLIFQFVPGRGRALGKQAKMFKIGDQSIFMNLSAQTMEYPTVDDISIEVRLGAYSPLTTSGSFFADGFLVSSYANVDSFAVAEGAVLPLKLWYRLTRVSKRKTVCSESGSCDNAKDKCRCHGEQQQKGIHPYAKFFMSFRDVVSSRFTPK